MAVGGVGLLWHQWVEAGDTAEHLSAQDSPTAQKHRPGSSAGWGGGLLAPCLEQELWRETSLSPFPPPKLLAVYLRQVSLFL